jgi:serine phosphatase RsbU (regulator of sigma subunit)/anti-sigma regulatory factor (Ser/Thr protein kinase)
MNKTITFLTNRFRRQAQAPDLQAAVQTIPKPETTLPDFDLQPDDPLNDYFRANPSVALLEKLHIHSPALERLKQAGVKLVVPLVSQGELIGMLNLGQRLSDQEYSSDDIGLLNSLAAQATPAVRVAQLVREQQEEAKKRERIEQELQVARLIQQTLLPKQLPEPEGWSVEAYYQPARAVGGDFYDFVQLPNNRLGIFVGDVTDKGVPAALVMATTRRILRFAAGATTSPGEVLEQANDLLCPDIPPNMFVTCLYAVLELGSGRLHYANAGHNPPYCYGNGTTTELRARGMPLGLMPAMRYEEREAVLQPGECLLFYSDGLTEAHNPSREMFGFERITGLMAASALVDRDGQTPHEEDHPENSPGSRFIRILLDEFEAFTQPGWEQEDDVTIVILNRHPEVQVAGATTVAASTMVAEATTVAGSLKNGPIVLISEDERMDRQSESKSPDPSAGEAQPGSPGGDQPPEKPESLPKRLAAFEIPSQPGNERLAMKQVAEAVANLGMDSRTLERLKTAVAEATMNAMEHGNRFQADLQVELEVWVTQENLSVIIRDHGGSQPIPETGTPDLDAKLAGEQSPRGWGLFLIEKMVDEMIVSSDESHHTVELVIHIQRTQS